MSKVDIEAEALAAFLTSKYDGTLGPTKVDEITNEVLKRGGNVVDLEQRLSKAAAAAAAQEASDNLDFSEMEKTFDRKMKLGLHERGLDRPAAKPKAAVDEETPWNEEAENLDYETASLRYGRGEMSTSEFQVYLDEHDKERERGR